MGLESMTVPTIKMLGPDVQVKHESVVCGSVPRGMFGIEETYPVSIFNKKDIKGLEKVTCQMKHNCGLVLSLFMRIYTLFLATLRHT